MFKYLIYCDCEVLGMNSEVKDAHIKLRISKEKKEELKKYAYSRGISVSSLIRYLLSEQVNLVQDEKTNNSGGKKDEK